MSQSPSTIYRYHLRAYDRKRSSAERDIDVALIEGRSFIWDMMDITCPNRDMSAATLLS